MKQMEVTEKKIGEYTFYIRPFPAFVAANISGELAALLTPMIGSLAPLAGGAMKENSEQTSKSDVMDVEIETALPAISNAFSSVSGDKFESLMKKLLINQKNVSVSGEATNGEVKELSLDIANEVFCGEVQDMYLLCFYVIKLNFGGFFKKLGTQFGNLQEIIQKRMAPRLENGEPSTSKDSANSN